MASGSVPYFIDPELSQSSAPDAQIYALAGGALQAHQEQHQLAGLVQAATAAADHDEQGDHDLALDAAAPPQTSRRDTRKRRRDANDDGRAEEENGIADGNGDSGIDSGVEGTLAGGGPRQQQHNQQSTPALSSASALFRRPSKTAKKYTRPPMSKLFSSLELSPENFMQLQSAAKNYMLDPAHPDRQDTVGQRGKGDSELVKLRLWNCVKDFLENLGVGAQYFGPDVPGDEGQQRTMIWPRDKNNIIGAITPLLRRMVTNERQRQYAVETRRSGASTGNAADPSGDTQTKVAGDLVAAGGTPGSQELQLACSPASLFELTTGAKPSEYVVGEMYDWPMLQPHLVIMVQQVGLPENEMKQVVACISYHLRYTHREGFLLHKTACLGPCPWEFIDRMIKTGKLDSGTFEQPESISLPEKRQHMKPMLKQVFDIVQNVISSGSTRDGTTSLENPVMGRAPASPARDEASGDERYDNHSVMLHVSLLQDGSRIMPRREVQAHITPYLHSLIQDAVSWVGPVSLGSPTVKVLSPEGLVMVEDDATWQRMVKLAKSTVWMDEEMKVVVEFS